MHVKAFESNLSNSSVEVLEFEFTHLAAVHSVGEVGAEKVDVEFVSAEANFFVGIESDAYFAVLNLGVLLQIFHSSDNFGDTRLVVGAEQSGSVGDYEVLAHVGIEFGELFGVKHHIERFV